MFSLLPEEQEQERLERERDETRLNYVLKVWEEEARMTPKQRAEREAADFARALHQHARRRERNGVPWKDSMYPAENNPASSPKKSVRDMTVGEYAKHVAEERRRERGKKEENLPSATQDRTTSPPVSKPKKSIMNMSVGEYAKFAAEERQREREADPERHALERRSSSLGLER